jgi:hypothetical protein
MFICKIFENKQVSVLDNEKASALAGACFVQLLLLDYSTRSITGDPSILLGMWFGLFGLEGFLVGGGLDMRFCWCF